VHDDEWDGDIPLDLNKPASLYGENGEVVFNGDKLPWAPGQYEVRYHHDGKYNVMSIAEVEIYGMSSHRYMFNTSTDPF